MWRMEITKRVIVYAPRLSRQLGNGPWYSPVSYQPVEPRAGDEIDVMGSCFGYKRCLELLGFKVWRDGRKEFVESYRG